MPNLPARYELELTTRGGTANDNCPKRRHFPKKDSGWKTVGGTRIEREGDKNRASLLFTLSTTPLGIDAEYGAVATQIITVRPTGRKTKVTIIASDNYIQSTASFEKC